MTVKNILIFFFYVLDIKKNKVFFKMLVSNIRYLIKKKKKI